jgi:hypothetical protein
MSNRERARKWLEKPVRSTARPALGRSCLGIVLFLAACDPDAQYKRDKAEAWEEPCADKAWLLATTSGSPSAAECPNKHHRMRVQVATTPSKEEIGALVFCECVHDVDASSGKE